MTKFVFLFRRGSGREAEMSPAEMSAHVRKWYAWSDALAEKGYEPRGQPLDPSGRTIRGTDRVVSDGPYVEMKDLVTGSMVVTASSLDDAAEIARGCPVFDFGGSVEVRPIATFDV